MDIEDFDNDELLQLTQDEIEKYFSNDEKKNERKLKRNLRERRRVKVINNAYRKLANCLNLPNSATNLDIVTSSINRIISLQNELNEQPSETFDNEKEEMIIENETRMLRIAEREMNKVYYDLKKIVKMKKNTARLRNIKAITLTLKAMKEKLIK